VPGFQLGVNTVATAINLPHIVETWEQCLRHAQVDVFTLASFRMPRDERGMYHRDAQGLTLDHGDPQSHAHWRAILAWASARHARDGIQFIFPYSRAEWARLLGGAPLPSESFAEKDTPAASDAEDSAYCCVPWLKVGVLADGTVIPCHLLYWPAPEITFGSLAESDFATIWNGPAYTQFRQQMASGRLLKPCADCRSWWRHYSPQRIE
jgi:radical SAM protein with 4Fe4S-binding SPASM domain